MQKFIIIIIFMLVSSFALASNTQKAVPELPNQTTSVKRPAQYLPNIGYWTKFDTEFIAEKSKPDATTEQDLLAKDCPKGQHEEKVDVTVSILWGVIKVKVKKTTCVDD